MAKNAKNDKEREAARTAVAFVVNGVEVYVYGRGLPVPPQGDAGEQAGGAPFLAPPVVDHTGTWCSLGTTSHNMRHSSGGTRLSL